MPSAAPSDDEGEKLVVANAEVYLCTEKKAVSMTAQDRGQKVQTIIRLLQPKIKRTSSEGWEIC